MIKKIELTFKISKENNLKKINWKLISKMENLI